MSTPKVTCRKAIAAMMVALCLSASVNLAGQAQPPTVPSADTCTVDSDGTLHVTRVIPLPNTVSPEAQKFLASIRPPTGPAKSLAERRAEAEEGQRKFAEKSAAAYQVKIEEGTMAGVRTKVVTPLTIPKGKQKRVLINVHGGGFYGDYGSMLETIPIAHLTQTKVVAVLYRLAPENPFPAAVEDTVAVYKHLLQQYKPQNIGLYGTSAGAILTPEATVRFRQLGLPLPAVLGVFSGTGDLSKAGESAALYALNGFVGPLAPPSKEPRLRLYLGKNEPTDPVVSPLYADLKGFPPTLFVTSTRDTGLSGTTILHRAFLRAGVDAQLVVFEALPHAFWVYPDLPESKEVLAIMAGFFDQHLGRR
jgi:acetyl esterase/lipase